MVLFVVVAILQICTLASAYSQSDSPERSLPLFPLSDCTSLLGRLESGQLFPPGEIAYSRPILKPEMIRGYAILPTGKDHDAGFIMFNPRRTEPMKKTMIPISSDEDERLWSEERWSFGDKKFLYVNTGFKNLESYSLRVHKLIHENILAHPDDDLEFVYGSERVHQGQLLRSDRWAFHSEVIRGYFEGRKSYLDSRDGHILSTMNFDSDNSDVFALVDGASLNRHLGRDRGGGLLITAQVSYFGNRNFFTANEREFERAIQGPNGPLTYGPTDLFPNEYRYDDTAEARAFKKELRKIFKPEETCEITRYYLFDKNLPVAAKAKFLYKLFKSISDRKEIKHIIIGADGSTGMLFNQEFRFILHDILPITRKNPSTSKNEKSEILAYLDTYSSEFSSVKTKLMKMSEEVIDPHSYSEDDDY